MHLFYFIFFLIKQFYFRRFVWLGTDPRGGWCPSRCCCGSPPCTRTWTRPGCRAPPRWTAACCTSRTWNSWGETLCSWPCAPGRWAGSPGRIRHTWCQTSCWRTQNCCVSLPVRRFVSIKGFQGLKKPGGQIKNSEKLIACAWWLI